VYVLLLVVLLVGRWQNVQLAMDEHRRRLDGALEVHAFNRDVDDINDRIIEKVLCRRGYYRNNLVFNF